jgi:hypothetical protein
MSKRTANQSLLSLAQAVPFQLALSVISSVRPVE